MSDTTEEKSKLVVSTGPFKNVVILGHTSVEQRDTEAGKVGSTLEDADYSDIYRSTLPEIHDKAAKVLAEKSGVPRGVNAEQTAKNQKRVNDAAAKAGKEAKTVANVDETFVDYANRVKADPSVSEELWKEIDTEFRAIALATPVDASPSKRVGTPPKDAQEKAADILSRDEEAIDASVEKMLAIIPNYDLERDANGKPDAMSLARMIVAYYKAAMAAV